MGWVVIGDLVHYAKYVIRTQLRYMAKIYIRVRKSYAILVVLFSYEQKQFASNACAEWLVSKSTIC